MESMITLFAVAMTVALILFGSEIWWRVRHPNSEFSRKFIHVTVGTFVAFWPFFLSWEQIRFLALGFVVVICVSKWFGIFRSIHSVQRPTWGEVFFALVVGLLTFVTHSKAIYTVSLLQMSLADGLAAITGVEYGKKFQYFVFGHAKSIVGSLAFLVTSWLLLFAYMQYTHDFVVAIVIILPLVGMLIENLAVGGLDNLLVPLLFAVVLTNM